ncbi:MAG: hypothetical protein RBQ97_08800 [Acholeplasma sp.]|nr:hypothetical protein [Acholeplasma sp.]
METAKFYIFYISIALFVTIVVIKHLKNKDDKYRYRFVLILSTLTIVLHLIKPFFFPYNERVFPDILRKITFENICAVSALIYLPIILSKNKYAMDYITTIGLLGGFLAFMYPTEIILGDFDSMPITYKLGLFDFDTIRFYSVHYLIFLIPFILIYFKLHTFSLKRAIVLPISILVILIIIFVNEIILEKLGWLNELHQFYSRNIFYDKDIRNSSFVFGLPTTFKSVGVIVDVFVFKFLKEPNYFPVLWITIPAFVYGPLIYLGFSYFADSSKTKKELNSIFMKKEHRS